MYLMFHFIWLLFALNAAFYEKSIFLKYHRNRIHLNVSMVFFFLRFNPISKKTFVENNLSPTKLMFIFKCVFSFGSWWIRMYQCNNLCNTHHVFNCRFAFLYFSLAFRSTWFQTCKDIENWFYFFIAFFSVFIIIFSNRKDKNK